MSNDDNVKRILGSLRKSPLLSGYDEIQGALATVLDYDLMLNYAERVESQGYRPFGGYTSSTNCDNATYCAKFARGVGGAGGIDFSWYVMYGAGNVQDVSEQFESSIITVQ